MECTSVIIVGWQVRDLLRGCLTSIAVHEDRDALEVWVIDNGSTDDTAAMVAAEFPWVRLVARDDNPGFAAGNNHALRQASGDVCILLNPDTELHDAALTALAAYLRAHPAVGVVGPRLLNPDGSVQSAGFAPPSAPLLQFPPQRALSACADRSCVRCRIPPRGVPRGTAQCARSRRIPRSGVWNVYGGTRLLRARPGSRLCGADPSDRRDDASWRPKHAPGARSDVSRPAPGASSFLRALPPGMVERMRALADADRADRSVHPGIDRLSPWGIAVG